jgi:hypothetical protein
MGVEPGGVIAMIEVSPASRGRMVVERGRLGTLRADESGAGTMGELEVDSMSAHVKSDAEHAPRRF